jgi:hypothetical protein
MFDNNKQPATNKQLWKINHLADQAFNLSIEAEVKEHGKLVSDAKDLSISLIFPLNKEQAKNWIKVLMERVAGLESLIEVLDQDIEMASVINGEQNADNV